MKILALAICLSIACAVDEPTTSVTQSNLCTAQDQQAGLCLPFSLAAIRAESQQWSQESYPTNLGVTVDCWGSRAQGTFQCNISIDIGTGVLDAGCAVWSSGDYECWVE